MADDRFVILLNDALKAHFVSLRNGERVRMREKFEFLENGFWDSGVRVKKLKGVAARVIFEARLSRSDRLLFTLGEHRGRTAIYVWGLVSHDDIASEAARIEPRNAPFLDFQPLEREERDDLSIDSLPREWFSQEDVEQKVPEDYGPQRWLVLDDEEWQRLLASPDPDTFEAFLFLTREQEQLLQAVPPILLSGTAGSGKTTLSVYYLVRGASAGKRRLFLTYNPLLKQLAQGIYEGLMEKRVLSGPMPPVRFQVFRDLLRDITRPVASDFPAEKEVGLREFTQIFNDHKDRRRYDAELVWEEVRAIVKGSKLPLAPARFAVLSARHAAREMSPPERDELREYLLGLQELAIARRAGSFIESRTSLGDYRGFLRAMREPAAATDDDCRRVLDELLALVQKSASDFATPLLSVEEYLAIGRKRSPAFLYDRREIYAIAEFYQERLERSGRWDEVDLTKAAIRLLDGAPEEFAHDLVVCDEVQDLTDVQVSLLFRLVADPRGVVLAGDPRQIVNPSGFRWEEVKNKLYERGLAVPEVHRLSLNFRCVGSIVRLSNALLDIKAGLVGISDTDSREEWKFGGKPPLLLDGHTEEEVLSRIDFQGAGQVILTRTAEGRDGLKRRLGTELVFTIAEAKGLEFDTVLLWHFCDDPSAEAVWRDVRSGGAVEPARVPHVRHELALLYVAVTRARNTLIVYDGTAPAVIWEIEALSQLVFRTGETDRLAELWRTVSTPEEWEAQGDYFFGHEHYAAARECYKNAGHGAKMDRAAARVLREAGDFAGAAPLFQASGEPRLAAECFETAGDWRRAQMLWGELGEQRRQAQCAARVHERDGDFESAARGWESLGEAARARECWEKAGVFDHVGRLLAAAGDFARAAAMLEKAKLPLEAAACLARIGREEGAADLYFQGGDFAQAARLYRKLGDDEKLLLCYRRLGDQFAIGVLHEARGEVRKAVDAFAAFARRSVEDQSRLLAAVPEVKSKRSALKAAIRLSALGMPEKAGPLFLRAGDAAMAAHELEKAGDFAALAQCFEEMGRLLDAARALERSSLEPREMVPRVQNLLYRHFDDGTSEDREAFDALHAEALRMKSEGRLAPALARFRLLQDEENVRIVSRALGMHEEALLYFLKSDLYEDALKYASSAGVSVGMEFIESVAGLEWTEDPPEAQAQRSIGTLVVLLLSSSLAGMPEAECKRLIEKHFFTGYGHWVAVDALPRAALDLLLKHRVANVIINLLYYDLMPVSEPGPRLRDFVDQVARAARESGDAAMSACASYATDREAFERTAAALALTEENVTVLAMSTARYREAVGYLERAGRIEEAEVFCRIQRDHFRGAALAEKRGEMRIAARSYMLAKDFEAALRCHRAAGDERGAAYALERMDRLNEALAIWEKLGRGREVQRLRKKMQRLHSAEKTDHQEKLF